MKEFIAFVLPPATALAGMRISRLILGRRLDEELNFGLRFALGLAVGMVVFSQSLLLAALLGVNATALLGWTALIWGAIELVLLSPKLFASLKQICFERGHLWFLTLLPVVVALWEFARLSTLDGTQEFDAGAFWLVKAKMLYFDHGRNFLALLHTPNFSYTHMDYPWLVPGVYTLTYGVLGGVDEFVVKVWPFWMLVILCGAILSISRAWRQPHPAPILLVVLVCFLPATWRFVRQEGATMPLLFGVGIAALLFVTALVRRNELVLCAGVLTLACCATTKLEGAIYTALWGTMTLLFCWRRGWLKSRLVWKVILIAGLCLAPYFYVRLQKPVLYPEAAWLHDGLASPGTVLRRFPQTVFLSFGQRFFHTSFFHWDPDNDHLHFTGKWQGFDSFSGPELSLLPWLLLALIALTFWKKPAHRLALTALLAVILGELLMLSLVISCLGKMQASLYELIIFTSGIVGRYYYPFFTACFLGAMAIWFLDRIPVPASDLAQAQIKDAPPMDAQKEAAAQSSEVRK
jgi:hypothetical protein